MWEAGETFFESAFGFSFLVSVQSISHIKWIPSIHMMNSVNIFTTIKHVVVIGENFDESCANIIKFERLKFLITFYNLAWKHSTVKSADSCEIEKQRARNEKNQFEPAPTAVEKQFQHFPLCGTSRAVLLIKDFNNFSTCSWLSDEVLRILLALRNMHEKVIFLLSAFAEAPQLETR